MDRLIEKKKKALKKLKKQQKKAEKEKAKRKKVLPRKKKKKKKDKTGPSLPPSAHSSDAHPHHQAAQPSPSPRARARGSRFSLWPLSRERHWHRSAPPGSLPRLAGEATVIND